MPAVVGRAAELAVIDEFLTALTDGPSAIVLEGEPGIGKTTLWSSAVEQARARGVIVLASRPSASETRLTYAGLADLLADVADESLDVLPGPQRRALDVALLRAEPEGAALEQLAIAAAFLGVLRALAADGPVLVAVDDVQWLDTPSQRVVEFAVRRLTDERVGVLAAVRVERAPGTTFSEADPRRLTVPPLNLAELHEIVKAELGVAFARPTLVRIEAVSSGNPFFALEIARELATLDELPHTSAPLPVPSNLADLVVGRLRRLPASSRRALVVACALSTPTVDALDGEAISRAESAGVVTVDERGAVRFTHPLLAASVYASASAADRRRIHHELATLAPTAEERARHLALAADGPDASVASALTTAAQLARDRGAPDAAIELLELACRRTPPDDLEAAHARKLALGRHLSEAGDPTRAAAALRDVSEHALDGSVRARALLLLAFMSETSETGEAANELCEKALSAAAGDVELRIEILAATSRMSDYDVVRKVSYAEQALTLTSNDRVSDQLRSYVLLAVAEAGFFAGRDIDTGAFRRAAELESAAADASRLAVHRVHHYADVRPSQRLLGILQIYADELDDARIHFEIERDIAWEHGDEVQLARTLIRLGLIEVRAGNWELADRHLADAGRVLERTEQEALERWMLATVATLDALRGRPDEARTAGERALELSVAAGALWGIAESRAALGFLDLSLGDPAAASAHLDVAAELSRQIGPDEPRLLRSQADHVEALVGLGELERAEHELARLERSRSSWAVAIGGRCRGLLHAARGDFTSARAALEDALAAHARLPLPFELARTHLVAGQIHRRRNERRLAGEALDHSIVLFEGLGAPLWAERADAERERLGLRRGTSDDLTPTEEQVASLAASGLTNRRIAEQMFISPKTVEANLSRAYRKLGIHSRAELGALMSERDHPTSA